MNKDRIANACVCCDNVNLKSTHAVLMPFIAHRVFNHEPFQITSELDLKRYGIKNGTAYHVCKTLFCTKCSHIFLDIRFDDREMNLLYDNYREKEYINLRDHYEPGYKLKNEQLNTGYNYVHQIEEFLVPHLDTSKSFKILDWGGDTGKNTPFYDACQALHIYDISNRETLEKATRIDKEQMAKINYELFVCSNVLEHISYPRETLEEIRGYMNKNSILYIELPYENLIRKSELAHNLENVYKEKRHWHEHINFFNIKSIEEMLLSCSYEILDLKSLSISGETSSRVFQVACRIK